MTTDIQWKLIVSTIFLTLIFSLNVVECCSKSKTTTEKPAEATDAPDDSKSSTMMNDDGSMMTDAPADPNSSTMMNGNGTMMAYNSTMMAYNSTMMAGSTTEKSLYTPYYNMTYEETPLIAMAIFAEAIDSNYTQQANESLNDYTDSNLGSFPDDALGGNAGKKKSWIPITGIMGNVTFTYNGSAVKIEGSVKGVPDGTHGFHIHEYPLSNGIDEHDPKSPDYIKMYREVQDGICRTSKRHYDIDGFGVTNPDRPLKYPNGTYIRVGNRRGHGLQHGYDYFQNRTRHVGDTGNIVSTDVDGWTPIEVEDKMANMHYGHTNSILYRTVVIHQLEDFGRSPIGPRIACGIIWPVMEQRPSVYEQKDKFWTEEQCTKSTMEMPPNFNPTGVYECQKKCDSMNGCNAIEYGYVNAVPCCIKLECQDPLPEPTGDVAIGNTKEEFHKGGSHNYVAYAKVMPAANPPANGGMQ